MAPENTTPDSIMPQNMTPENTGTMKQSIGDLLDSEIVTIYVGPSKTLFHVHKKLLCTKVPYFAAMFRSGSTFPESETFVINFPEDKPEDFKILLSWLYQDEIPEVAFSLPKDSGAAWMTLWSFYTLADKFNLVEAMDKSIDTFLKAVSKDREWVLSPQLLAKIYSTSPSGLRKLCAHSLAYGITAVHSENEVETPAGVLHGDIQLLCDVLKVFHRARATGEVEDPRGIRECDFHVHGEKSLCAIGRINGYRFNGRRWTSYRSPSPFFEDTDAHSNML